MSEAVVTVLGAGLAGCEAAWQAARRGVKVRLFEMKPNKKTPAHKSDTFAELVCSNSLRSLQIFNAVGLLKEEMRRLDSLIMRAADSTSVPAGASLAVDREKFSKFITDEIRNNENIEIGRKSQEIFAEILAGGRDNARTPICWDDSENAGFTTGVPWIRVNGDYKECNAKIQLEDSTSTFNYFKSLMALRKANKSTLVYGDFKPIETNDKTFCLYRESSEGKFYIEMNLTENIVTRPRPAEGECVLSNYPATADKLRAYEVNIYKVK